MIMFKLPNQFQATRITITQTVPTPDKHVCLSLPNNPLFHLLNLCLLLSVCLAGSVHLVYERCLAKQ